MQMEEVTLHFDVEKALKKKKRILIVLIIVLILLALYTIILAGDVSSVRQIEERKFAEQESELETDIEKLVSEKEKAEADIAEYEADIAELTATLESIENGTYVEE